MVSATLRSPGVLKAAMSCGSSVTAKRPQVSCIGVHQHRPAEYALITMRSNQALGQLRQPALDLRNRVASE